MARSNVPFGGRVGGVSGAPGTRPATSTTPGAAATAAQPPRAHAIRAHAPMPMSPALDPLLPCRSYFLNTTQAQQEVRRITRQVNFNTSFAHVRFYSGVFIK